MRSKFAASFTPDVHEIESDIRGETGGLDHVVRDLAEFSIGENVDAGIKPIFFREHRIEFGDARAHGRAVRPAEASGVGQLESDQQVVGRSVVFKMRRLQGVE